MEESDEKKGYDSPTSSPPTPPSPLPISVGPGNQKYIFSPSPSPSPPFSPPPSSHTSAENLPLLHHDGQKKLSSPTGPAATFSLDYRRAPEDLDSKSSCLKDLCQHIEIEQEIARIWVRSVIAYKKWSKSGNSMHIAEDLDGDFDWIDWFIERCCNCGATAKAIDLPNTDFNAKSKDTRA